MDFAVPPACRRLRALLFVVPLLAAAALCLAAPAAAEEPMVFDVLRDGSKIGEHRLVFEREDSTLKVSVETDMSVRFAFVTVFRSGPASRRGSRRSRAGLAAEPAGLDVLHQQRAGPVLGVGQAVVAAPA
jgi:hypothetical protein